jgi:hypothetical protein
VAGKGGGRPDGALSVTQIQLGDRTPMRRLSALPPDARDFEFDGDYLYFTRAEQVGDTGGQAWSLYRIRPPD